MAHMGRWTRTGSVRVPAAAEGGWRVLQGMNGLGGWEQHHLQQQQAAGLANGLHPKAPLARTSSSPVMMGAGAWAASEGF